MAGERYRPCLFVVAGTNGAGKSSIAGAMIRQRQADYFNPDEAALEILARKPGLGIAEANGAAWMMGRRLLESAIERGWDFAFETTLGGATITCLLEQALDAGHEVRIWYVGLAGPEPYVNSVANLVRLLPRLTELHVYDNSREADPHAGKSPRPRLVLHVSAGVIEEVCDLAVVPEWAKPVVQTALKVSQR